jgi:hypothetical protein
MYISIGYGTQENTVYAPFYGFDGSCAADTGQNGVVVFEGCEIG